VYDIEKDGPTLKLAMLFDTTFYSPYGKQIIGVEKNIVYIMDALTGKLVKKRTFSHPINQLVQLKNQKSYLFVTQKDSTLQYEVLDAMLNTSRKIFAGHANRPAIVLSYRNGIGIYQFTDSSYIRYAFNNQFKLVNQYKEDSVYGQPFKVAFDTKNELAAFAMSDTSVHVVSKQGKWKYLLDYFPNGVGEMLFCNQGKNLLVKSERDLVAFNATDGNELAQLDCDSTVADPKSVTANFSHDTLTGKFYFVLGDNYIYESSLKGNDINVSKKIKGLTKGVDKIDVENGEVTYGSGDGFVKQIDLKNAGIKNFYFAHNSFLTSFAKNNSYYLTTSWDSTIKVWDKQNFSLVHSRRLDDKILEGSISKDSQVLAVKGNYGDKLNEHRSSVLLYNLKKSGVELWKHFDRQISAAIIINDNEIALALEDSTIHLFSDSLKELKNVKTASWVIGMEYREENKKLFALTLTDVEVYNNSLSLLNKIPIFNENGTGSLDADKNANNFLLGNKDGIFQYYSVQQSKVLFSVKASNDGLHPKFITDTSCITISESGIIKYWKIADTAFVELCTIIPFENGDYVTLLPSGFYKGSKKGAASIHYVTKDLKVITFEQLDIRYNRPDKVLEALGSADAGLISSYKKAYEKRIRKIGVDTTHFTNGFSIPEADIANRNSIHYEQSHNKLLLRIKASDKDFKLTKFNVWVNDVPVFGLLSKKIKPTNFFDTTITIVLSTGENNIATGVMNSNGTESYRMPLLVKYSPLKKTAPKVCFFGIGINQFANPEYNLNWSVKDIRDLAVKLKSKYPNIIIDTLFDWNVTKANILALKTKLLQLNEDDKVIVSYSGHGVLSKQFDYFLSTYTINFNDPEINGLAYDDLESLFDGIRPRQKLMLIDACHSGELDKDEIAKIEASKKTLDSSGIVHKSTIKVIPKKKLGMASSFELMQSLFVNVGKGTGATIISAAGGMQYAQERGDLKNGVFTYSIIEAMNSNASLSVSQLKKIVGERVTQLTNGLQKPTSRNETNNYDWIIW
jgi:hypothetical protein